MVDTQLSEFIDKIPNDEIPKVLSNSDGMVVRLSKEHRRSIIGIDGAKYYIPSVAMRDGTKIIFIVGQEEAMPDRDECLKLKKQGLLFGLPVSRNEIIALDIGDLDFLSFNIINTNDKNQIAFKVEIRRMEDLKK